MNRPGTKQFVHVNLIYKEGIYKKEIGEKISHELRRMGIFEDLQEKMKGLENKATHNGYWYRISEALIILICGLLCRQQKIDDIHDWAKSMPTRKFLQDQFGIERIFSRAQFYNLLAVVDAEAFKLAFTKWMQHVLCDTLKGKTVSIDRKTVCGTDKLTKDGNVAHSKCACV